MHELAEHIGLVTFFFAMVAASSICIGVTAFVWTVIYRQWRYSRDD